MNRLLKRHLWYRFYVDNGCSRAVADQIGAYTYVEKQYEKHIKVWFGKYKIYHWPHAKSHIWRRLRWKQSWWNYSNKDISSILSFLSGFWQREHPVQWRGGFHEDLQPDHPHAGRRHAQRPLHPLWPPLGGTQGLQGRLEDVCSFKNVKSWFWLASLVCFYSNTVILMSLLIKLMGQATLGTM